MYKRKKNQNSHALETELSLGTISEKLQPSKYSGGGGYNLTLTNLAKIVHRVSI